MRYIQAIVDINSYYGRQVLMGFAQYARKKGDWEVVFPNPSQETLDEVPDGFLVQIGVQADLNKLAKTNGQPVVNIGDGLAQTPCASVYSDNRLIGWLAADHLVARGYSNLTYVGHADRWFSVERQEGARTYAAERVDRVRWQEPYVPPLGRLSIEDTDRWLASLPKPIAIVSANDVIGRRLIRICLRNGLRVPQDVAIVGADNDPLICSTPEVPLSSVELDTDRIGHEAGRLMESMLQGVSLSDTTVKVPPLDLVERASSCHLPISDPDVLRAMQYIETHMDEPIRVEHLLSELALSRRWLEQRFRRALDSSPAEEIRRARLSQARRLLVKSTMPLQQIAWKCGYADAASLSKAFKKHLKVNPSELRRETNPLPRK